jgi:hypothetical protein
MFCENDCLVKKMVVVLSTYSGCVLCGVCVCGGGGGGISSVLCLPVSPVAHVAI